MNYTDAQLKQALAKMLPETEPYWRNILDTELLHLCWLVEETLSADEKSQYLLYFWDLEQSRWDDQHATWQRRTVGLTKVKGVEIV